MKIFTLLLVGIPAFAHGLSNEWENQALSRLLGVYYKQEFLQRQFERELRAGKAELETSKSYQTLLASHPGTEKLEREVLSQASSVRGLQNILSQIFAMPARDRAVLAPFLQQLEQTKKMGLALEARKPLEAEIEKRANQFSKWEDPIFPRALVRRRASPIPSFYKPSPGPEGNFDGRALPLGTFVFTFDDGPSAEGSDKIMDTALNHRDPVNTKGVPISFFWQVVNAQDFPGQIHRAENLRIPLSNHSWDHPDNYGTLGPVGWKKQVIEADQELRRLYGLQPVNGNDRIFFARCPYGACVFQNKNAGLPEVRKMIANLGEIHVLWNIDTMDWSAPNRIEPQKTADLAIAEMKANKRGVILMHDVQPRTPEAFALVLEWIKKQNEAGGKIRLVDINQAILLVNGRR